MVYSKDKNFKIALIISLLCHSVIFFPFGHLFLNIKPPRYKSIEVTYYAAVKDEKVQRYTSVADKPAYKKEVVVRKRKDEGKARLNKHKEKSMPDVVSGKKQTFVKKPDVKPIVNAEMKKMPSYLSYYQILRAKIKRNVKYPNSLNEGQVYLNFRLTSDGKLEMIRINEEVSTSNVLLRTAALESIQKATPFPPFPEDFKQNEATFNVIISFEIK